MAGERTKHSPHRSDEVERQKEITRQQGEPNDKAHIRGQGKKKAPPEKPAGGIGDAPSPVGENDLA
ncbi:hypothetical protein ABLE91_17090 [Aquabacter sp. CN5-332]|uniref:hypothetical protein n=1 Tax=Aquabacter sp. CN5-332 TaxID=3156608 RepID=UPI0032B3C859